MKDEGSNSFLRFLIYLWTFPTTCVGLLFIPLAMLGGGKVQIVQGVLEIHGQWIAWLLRTLVPIPGGASAMTLGHVVIARDQACLDSSREHERVHVRQCERWGPFFIPAYLLASLLVKIRGLDAYRDNPFEREAYERS
ncbi:MAG TPA: hypothetical protein VHD56_07780 [Tepidisphaeraceae bacterium]|nr:hypothetical protein [Tepidisphaeraceae bacterium]